MHSTNLWPSAESTFCISETKSNPLCRPSALNTSPPTTIWPGLIAAARCRLFANCMPEYVQHCNARLKKKNNYLIEINIRLSRREYRSDTADPCIKAGTRWCNECARTCLYIKKDWYLMILSIPNRQLFACMWMSIVNAVHIRFSIMSVHFVCS